MRNVHNIEPHVAAVVAAARNADREAFRKAGRSRDQLTDCQRKLHDSLQAYDRVLQIGSLERA